MSDRAEWLAWRRSGIGASDVAGILGVSPWSSPWSVWADKLGLTPDAVDSDRMEFGRRAEGLLADYFASRTGLVVRGEQTRCTHPDEPWMICTLDGYACDGQEPVGLFEAKTTGDAPWDEVPVYYVAQAQWQMAVTGMDRVWFGVLHLAFGRPAFRVYEVAADREDMAAMVAACRAFWCDHVAAQVAPAADGHDATGAAIAAAWADSDPDAVAEADADLEACVEHLRQLKADAKALDAAIAEAENTIKAAIGSAEALRALDGTDLATWRSQDRTAVDVAALRAAAPDLVAAHTTTTSSRVLRLKKGRR